MVKISELVSGSCEQNIESLQISRENVCPSEFYFKKGFHHIVVGVSRDRYYKCTYYLMQEFKPRSKGPVAEFWIGRFFFNLTRLEVERTMLVIFFNILCNGILMHLIPIIHLLGFAFFKATFSISFSGKWNETIQKLLQAYLKSMTRQFHEFFNLIFGGFLPCLLANEQCA